MAKPEEEPFEEDISQLDIGQIQPGIHQGHLITVQGLKENPDNAARIIGMHAASMLSDRDLIQVLTSRRLAQGIIGAEQYNEGLGWLYTQAKVNQKVMHAFGYKKDEIAQAPTIDSIVKRLGASGLMALGEIITSGRELSMSILPNVLQIGLEGEKGKPGFIPRHDRLVGSSKRTAWSGITEIFKVEDKDPQHHPLADSSVPWIVSFTIGGEVDDGSTPDQFGEGGLVYTDMNVNDQREVMAAEADTDEYGPNLLLAPVNLMDYIWRCAQLRLSGRPLLDSRYAYIKDDERRKRQNDQKYIDFEADPSKITSTTLLNYPDVKTHEGLQTLVVHTNNGRIQLGARLTNQGTENSGVRRVLRLIGKEEAVEPLTGKQRFKEMRIKPSENEGEAAA